MLNLFLMFSSTIAAFAFTQMSHPLASGLMLLLQTLIVALIAGFMTQSFWFSYILFLVFLGGLLVLFIYVTSLASNEMFSLSLHTLLYTSLPLLSIGVMFSFLDPHAMINLTNNTDLYSPTTELPHLENAFSLMKLYNNPTSLITLMLVLYLFLTLIAVVKITKISHGPLRLQN
uniref:NADH-ubiquinone oxidoreductase chain 6 n=1 Tax=Togoperla limbata TaxID=1268353 RepID=A0A7U3NHX0_9NEOP|nr:NADH dehydrogenase subunit 6 [Togoperla limbata]QOV02877.1 NADH dehydrogenase subunit 6 [Togoperla limbata]